MSRLPTELERLVFECAAVNRSQIPTLLLVAHRVRIWLEPILYHLLLLNGVRSIESVLTVILSKPPAFLESAVRHLLLYSSPFSLKPDTLSKFMHRCPGITSLSLIGDITGPHLLPALAQMHSLKRLSIEMTLLFPGSEVDLDHPLFACITHLDLFEEVYIEEEDEPEDLLWLTHPQAPAKMPNLEYLGFNTQLHPSFLRAILQRYQQLRVLVVGFTATDEESAVGFLEQVTEQTAAMFEEDGEERVGVGMERLVVGTYDNPYQDWERGVRGGEDVWVRAEEFVRRKRGGEVDAANYYMPVKKRQS
ncbi:tyrosinase central domain-containing protein [Favolaschia claudopus]|uniref:Tyrosinase central domain-containing protein n=1 Tax=Favolaschia claudopus TaxID=2862362 RepID=A0AAW0BA12_9AGAR